MFVASMLTAESINFLMMTWRCTSLTDDNLPSFPESMEYM
jgi:hypothetical protein